MDCRRLVELVTAYLDGSLDLDARERFDLICSNATAARIT